MQDLQEEWEVWRCKKNGGVEKQEARGVEEWRCKKHKNRDALNKNIGAAERRIVQVLKCKNQEKRRCGDVDL